MTDIKTTIRLIREVPGTAEIALVDMETGLCIARTSQYSKDASMPSFEMDKATEFYARFLKEKVRLHKELGIDEPIDEPIEEIVFSFTSQHHLLYPCQIQTLRVKKPQDVFFFVRILRDKANLGGTRTKIQEITRDFSF